MWKRKNDTKQQSIIRKNSQKIIYNHWSTIAFHWCHVCKNMIHLSLRVSKRLTLSSFYFLSIICIYTCHSPGHCYKQIWYFTPLFSRVVASLGFGLVIRMFFWWRGDRPFTLCCRQALCGCCCHCALWFQLYLAWETLFHFLPSAVASWGRRRRRRQHISEIHCVYISLQYGDNRNLKHTYN